MFANGQRHAIGLTVIPVTRHAQNCSIIWCCHTGAAAVIDPGGDVDRILAEAAHHNVRIERILLTHGHADHTGGAPALAEQTGAAIFGPHMADRVLMLPALNPASADWLDRVTWLTDGDAIHVGDLALEVRHCPGHTPGHVAFIDRAACLAWVGDILFAGSIGVTDMPYADRRQLISSITQRLWPFGDDIRFVPGHGRTSTFGAERQLNPFVSDIAIEALGITDQPRAPRRARRPVSLQNHT